MEGERGAITDGDETTVHFSLSPSYPIQKSSARSTTQCAGW